MASSDATTSSRSRQTRSGRRSVCCYPIRQTRCFTDPSGVRLDRRFHEARPRTTRRAGGPSLPSSPNVFGEHPRSTGWRGHSSRSLVADVQWLARSVCGPPSATTAAQGIPAVDLRGVGDRKRRIRARRNRRSGARLVGAARAARLRSQPRDVLDACGAVCGLTRRCALGDRRGQSLARRASDTANSSSGSV